jgi:hypothetical protein
MLTDNLNRADFILGLKSHLKDNVDFISQIKNKELPKLPIYVIKNNNMPEIKQIITYYITKEKLKNQHQL